MDLLELFFPQADYGDTSGCVLAGAPLWIHLFRISGGFSVGTGLR